jgi:hypothetical protein
MISMSDHLAARVSAIDASTLLPLVERAIGEPVLRVRDWQITPVSGGFAAPIWRVQGHAEGQPGQTPWSMILKVPGADVGLGDPWGGVREAQVYASGFRSPVADTFRLPGCYGVVEQPLGRPWLWLEDVSHDPSPQWTMSRYADVARCLGQFNGAFLVDCPLPAWSWIGTRGHLRQLLQGLLPGRDAVAVAAYFWRQQGELAAHIIDRFVDFYAFHPSLLAVVDGLPLTLCHGDAFQRNLLVPERCDTSLQVVAIDWSQAGLSVPGADAGHLVSMAACFSHVAPEQMRELDRVVFPAYVQGLRDVGWEGDDRLVRLGYTAATSLWDGLTFVGSMAVFYRHAEERAWMSEVFGWPTSLAADILLAMLQYHLDLADEAHQLAESLNLYEVDE